jgi:hypothetical protein
MSTKPASKTPAKKTAKPAQKTPDKFWVIQVDSGNELTTEPLGPFDSEAAALAGVGKAVEDTGDYDCGYADSDCPVIILKEVAFGYPKVSVSVELLAEKPKH